MCFSFLVNKINGKAVPEDKFNFTQCFLFLVKKTKGFAQSLQI